MPWPQTCSFKSRMIESQVTTEDVQECASPIPEIQKWQLSPEFEISETEQIPVTQIPQKNLRRPRPRRPHIPFTHVAQYSPHGAVGGAVREIRGPIQGN